MSDLNGSEIATVLRRAVEGKSNVYHVGPSWSDVYAGEVEFDIDGYRFVIFNDCDTLDYMDNATSPDGRKVDFDSLFDTQSDPICFNGDGMLTGEERAQLEHLLRIALQKP